MEAIIFENLRMCNEVNKMIKWITDNKEFVTLVITFIGLLIGYVKFKKEFQNSNNQFKALNDQNLKDRISSTTSTFRQNWVQEFRSDISGYYALINRIGLLTEYNEEYLTQLSKKEYDLLLRLNIISEVDKTIELELNQIRELYLSLFAVLKYDNWDICDDVIYQHDFTELHDKREAAHKEMAKKVSQDMYLDNEKNILSEEEISKTIENYEKSVEILVRDTKNIIIEKIKNKKTALLVKLRVYLKVEWERIKFEIENGHEKFNFTYIYEDTLKKTK